MLHFGLGVALAKQNKGGALESLCRAADLAPQNVLTLGGNGRYFLLGQGEREDAGQIAKFSKRDAEAWPKYNSMLRTTCVATELKGVTVKGATRWLDIGVGRIQPSEIMKLGLPLMLAWYFNRNEATLRLRNYLVAALMLAFPVALILRQPDLGTSLLIAASSASAQSTAQQKPTPPKRAENWIRSLPMVSRFVAS